MDNQKTDTRKANRSPTLTKAQINVVPVPQIPEQTIDFDLFKRNVIACGPSHALAIGSSEGLYGWGKNQFQQLGKSERKTILEVPTNIDLGVKGNEYVPVQVACGLKHSVVLAKPLFGGEGGIKVFTSGSKQNGRLGRKPSLGDLEDEEEEEEDDDDDDEDDHGIDIDGGNIKAAITQTVTSLDNKCILMVACGGSFSLALTNTGHIYSWGDGSSGALGLDTYDDVVDPRPLLLDSKKDKLPSMKFIAAGYAHSIGISSDGKMYGWGGGEMGQLGTLEPRNTSLPTLAYMPRIKIQMASCGMYNTMVVSEDQLLFGCGANKNGQLGFPDLTNRDHLEEVITLSNEPIKWVACGGNHTLVLSFSNKVFAFGNNNHLKCGVYDAQELGANITVPTQVEIETSLGGDHVYQVAASLHLSMAITKNGEILTWGKNSGGLLGRPTLKMEEESPTYNAKPGQEDLDEYKPGSIGSTFLKREGNDGDADKLSVSIKSIQCGLFHTVAVTNAGELYVWGSNEYGQHGQLTSDIQQAREAKAGKQNDKDRLELPPECLPSLVPQFDIKLNKRITSIGTGSHHIIAVENFRKIYAWGRNIEGQLGLGMSCKEIPEPTAIPELTGHVIREVAASEAHSLVLLESGEIYAFGSPLYGRLGIGLTSTLQLSPRKIYDLPKAMKIRCGPTHSMALVIERTEHVHTTDEKEDYALYTWGSGWGGKLGQGHIDNCFVPTRVDTSIRFSEISCGENHSAGITKKGKLYIWGPREYFGVIEKRASDILGEYKPKLSDFYILKPTPHNHHLFENEKFSYVSLGNHYNLALSETNVLYKWGNFDKSYEEDFQKTGGNHAHATDKDLADLERVEKHCDFLKNTFESLPEMQDFIISIDATSNHAVAFSQRYAYSWGIDSYTGRLGHTKDHGEGEEGAAEAKDDAYDKRFDHPKIIKFLANILNKNTQKLNMQRQMEALDDAQSGKTKKSSRSKKSADSRRQLGHSKSTAKGSKLNASSMASIIDVNEDDEAGGGSVVRRFLEDLRLSVEEHRYLRVINSTDELESIMKNVYQRYAEMKKHINTIGHFSHSAETIIVKRLLSKPFSITPSHKHIYKLPKEFTENRVAYARLYTILQLHPCYIRNIYLTKKIDVSKLYTIIKEVFGDMEGDKRKTKLFMALCLKILREELKNKNPYALSYDSLAEDKNDTTPLFTRLFKLFMKSSAQNMTYLNLVEGRLRAAVEAAISSVTNKQLKPYALVFRREDVSDILEKYKNESDAFRHAEMEKIVKRVKEAVDKVFDDINKKVIQGSGKENAGDVKSKSISASVKYLLKKCVDITMETFKNTELVPDQIESKALALIFVPLREKLKKNVKKENNGNILSLTNAIIMYIKGVSFSSENQKWVTELNNSIRKGDDRRRKLFSWFRIKDYNFEEKLVKSTFVHSTELENDKIQCTIGNLAFLTKFLKDHAAKVAVIHPQNLDYVAKFPEKLNQQASYLQKDPTAQEAKMIVNLKLKTRQLLYGDSSAMKICNDCDAFLKESLVSTNSRVLVEKISKEDPRSLDTYYKNFLIDLDDRKIEQLLEGSEEFESFTKKTIENYKAMADYEKVGSIATFLRGLEEELQAKHPFIATYDSQKMNQVRYELVKELQSRLMSRLKLEVVTLDEMEDHEMLFSRVKETVGNSCKTRNDEINNLKYILDAMKYGSSVQNPEADKIFSKNRQSMYSALKGQLSRTPQSKDLVENLNEAEKGNLKLFGKYSVKILRIKKILVEFYDPEFPNLNKKCKNSDKYSVIFTKSNKDIRISLIYTAKNATLVSLLLGSGKNSKDDFEEIVDETVLSEHDVLHITQSATKNKENPKIIKLGKFIEVNSSKFLELLNTLHSNQEIYDQQVMRTYNPKDVKKADIL